MAQRVITQLISDLSGDKIAEGQGETVEFSFRGTTYKIDLTDKESAGFDKAIAMYLEHATKVSGRRGRSTGSSSSKSDYDPKAVRAWASENSVEVPARGRIPGDIVEQYKAAN